MKANQNIKIDWEQRRYEMQRKCLLQYTSMTETQKEQMILNQDLNLSHYKVQQGKL